MSSFDIKACVNELQELIGGKVEKVYHYPPNEIRIKLYAKGRRDLVIEAGKRIHLTKFPRESPKFPSAFAMLLRKHLEGARIEKIEQYDFDRIVQIHFRRGDEKKILIAELFQKGNIILTDGNLRVIMPLRFDVKPGEVYTFPKRRDPIELIQMGNGKEVVKFLAVSGLGGLYAEETCLRAGIDKMKKFNELNEDEKRRIIQTIRDLIDFESKPQIILKNGEYYDVVPMDLKFYEKFEKRYFKTFNEALDEFYSKMISASDEIEEMKSKELEKLKKRLEIQLNTKKRYEEEIERLKRAGDAIYENYQVVDTILNALRKASERMSWDEIAKILKSRKNGLAKFIKSVKNGKVVLDLGIDVELDVSKDIHENADEYYEKAKKIKDKLNGLNKAIEQTKREIENVEESLQKKFVSSLRVARKREWYEKYRWFITSDGFLVIGGRNAEMNEEIVSKHLESKDLFFHTQSPGAPVVVLKRGQEAPERSIIETAIFAATYSALWKEGKHSGEVYYVLPEQVSKAAKAGEYLPKGSFYITGKRNYLTVELSCAIGVDLTNLRVIGGPKSAIEKYADYFVEIEIGDKDANDISVEIAKKLADLAGENRHIVKAIATPDKIMKFLPPGRSRIKV